MANSIAYATLFQKNLDKLAIQVSKTGWMDANAGQVIYNGGSEVKIPKISMGGLGNYSRSAGYTGGDVSLTYQTLTMTQDRSRRFNLDAMDVNESNFLATAGTVMAEFQRTQVTPEVDAYRISKLVTTAIGVAGDAAVEYGYTPANTSIISKIKAAIKTIRNNGFDGPLVCLCNYDVQAAVEEAILGKLQAVTFSQGGIDTKVAAIDDVPLIPVPANRMYSTITLYDGSTSGQTAGGYIKGSSALDVNFIVIAQTTPIAVTKQNMPKIVEPAQNQTYDGYSVYYRRYHDLWVKDNSKGSIYANIKDVKPV